MVPESLVPVVVLGGDLTVAAALRALAWLPDETRVAIEEPRGPGSRRIHVLTARMLHQGLPQVSPTLTLGVALGLDERMPALVRDFESIDPDGPPPAGAVIVDGPAIIGWVEPARAGSDGMRDANRSQEGFPQLGGDGEPAANLAPEGEAGEASARFRAFPELSAPAAVVAGDTFTISIGFGTSSSGAGGPVVIPGAPPVLTFEVQLSGFGLTFTSGATVPLSVTRDSPVERVEVRAVADAVPVAFVRSIEATYSLGGVPVGMAWCDVLVNPSRNGTSAPAHLMTTGRRSGGTELGLAPADAPDLTVTIRSRQGYAELSWSFQTPHAVTRPAAPVLTELSAGTAQAFASQVIQQLSKRRDDPFLDNEVSGIGDLVADQLPNEFWQVLAGVLRLVPAGRSPTVLLVLDEPYVPWELALVTDRLPPDLVPPNAVVPLLGCLFAVGRWVVPRRQSLGQDRPSAPPPATMNAPSMAVVVGDYASSALRLEGAIAEGATLVQRYDAVRVGIAAEEIHSLVEDTLERDGSHFAPALVHFALHGQSSSTQQQYVGLKIGADGQRLLHPMTLARSPMAGRNRPFVFLNACQVGSAMATLNSMGGLAPALVTGGSRGVIGPLWDVDDTLAGDLSTTFYTEVLDQGVPVGEAVRRLRATFGRTPVVTATPLAYVYYGHPALQLHREPAPSSPDHGNGATR